jgi:hypothetical protein
MEKLKRYQNNVGKYIGGALYFHKQYLDEMVPTVPQPFRKLLVTLAKDGFNIIKYVPNKTISLISSPDFDTAQEPRIRDYYTYNIEHDKWTYRTYTGISAVTGSVPIYHHKWLFVKDNYKGFNVEEAKRRSEYINREMDRRNINRRRIGYLKYWENLNI